MFAVAVGLDHPGDFCGLPIARQLKEATLPGCLQLRQTPAPMLLLFTIIAL